VKTLLALLVALALTGCGTLRQTAHEAIAADAITTAGALALGAGVEANPQINSIGMGVVTVGVRLIAVEHANRMDEPKRTNTLAAANAITWGVIGNNIFVIAAKYLSFLAVPHLSIVAGI